MIIFPANSSFGYTTSYYTPELLNSYPDFTFVFGDNLLRRGKGGQAVIRGTLNSYGFVTKVLPSTCEAAYLVEEQHEQLINRELDKLKAQSQLSILVFPSGGLGTGLSQLQTRAPQLLNQIDAGISELLGIDYKSLRN